MQGLKPLHDKVIGRMLEPVGMERKTQGGLIMKEDDFGESAIRPRWFEVTHVGPDQKDVSVGQFILLPHGRWSRGVDIEGSMKEEDKLFLVDHDDILGTSDDNPVE